MSRITIDCPDDLLVALGTTQDQFEQEAKFALAAKLYMIGLDDRELADELRYGGPSGSECGRGERI